MKTKTARNMADIYTDSHEARTNMADIFADTIIKPKQIWR